MTITYFPFGAGAGSTVDEAQWSAMAQWFRETGVVTNQLNEFEVYGDATGMQVKVKSGIALVVGHYIKNDAEVIKTIATADGSNPRIDRVVLQVDWVNNDITIDVLTGTPAGSPVAPSLTQNTSVWEISLARVYVGTGVSTINSTDVTDERVFSQPQNPGIGGLQSRTITSGAITVESEKGLSFYSLLGEGGAADTLTNINMSSPVDGAVIVLRGTSSYVITITEAGNITLGQSLAQIYLQDQNPIFMAYDSGSSKWRLISPEHAGKRSVWIPAQGFAPLDLTNVVGETINSVHPTLTFIDAADDYAVINIEMPKDYNGGNLNFYIWWIPAVTGTNAVVWEAAVDMLADGEAFSAFDDTDTVIDAAQNSITEVLRSGVITLTPTWVNNDIMVLRVGRLGTNGSDTLAGTANFVGVKMEYTTNKPNQD